MSNLTTSQLELIREVMWDALQLISMIAGKDEVFRSGTKLHKTYFAMNKYAVHLSKVLNGVEDADEAEE